MYIVKGIFLGVGIFVVGFILYVIRMSLKLPMGTAWDIRGLLSPTIWLVLLGLVLLCTAFFPSRRGGS